MRVLHIIDSGGLYGAEMMLLNLAKEQIRQGLEPVIASIGTHQIGEKDFEAEAIMQNLPLQCFRMHPGPNIFGAWSLLQYARSGQFDILHSHGYKGNILLGLFPKLLRKLPLITTVHGWTAMANTFSRMRLYELLDSWTFSRMNAVVLVSEKMRENSKITKKENVNFRVINNGITTNFPDNYPCEKLEFRGKNEINIVAVGRLAPEKGFDVLINAISQVAQQGIDISLTIFGEGGERSKLENLVRQLGLQERIRMPGFTGNAASTFPCFNFLIISSLTEGLPITLLEAMRAKLPIIATKVGDIPNVLKNGDCGLLVKAGNVQQLADAMSKFVNDPLMQNKLSENAFMHLKNNYSVEKMAEDYKTLYSDLVLY